MTDLFHRPMGQKNGIGFPFCIQGRANTHFDSSSASRSLSVANPHGNERNGRSQLCLEFQNHPEEPTFPRPDSVSNVCSLRKDDDFLPRPQQRDENLERIQGSNRLLSVHRETAEEGQELSNQRVSEEFFLSDKVKQGLEGKADDRNIGPVLMLGEYDHRSVLRQGCPLLGLDPVKKGKDPLCDSSRRCVDKGISFHSYQRMSNFKIQKTNEVPMSNSKSEH